MPADLLLTNARIYTVDPARPWAGAAAVMGDRIVAVGSPGELQSWVGTGTRVLDLRDRLVLPGFADSHVHFIEGGETLLGVQLHEAATPAEFTARIAAKARELPKGAWILGGNWDHQSFPGAELPRREWIDAVTPDHPVYVSRMDGHMALCNSLALKLAGLDRDSPTPDGGYMVRDPATGDLTGVLKDAARHPVQAVIPEPSPAMLRAEAVAALRAAAAQGVTTVHDVSGERGFAIYQDLLREGRLSCRITMFFPMASVEDVLKLELKSGFGSPMLLLAGLKGFSDGSLGSGTALFYDPYSDEPDNAGLFHNQMFPEGIMGRRIQAADAGGLNVAVHAIGDRAIASILDLFEAAAARPAGHLRRLRMEHVQHVRPGDLARMARLGMVASVQPYHAIDDGRWAERRIGPERAPMAFPYGSFLEAGVPMAFGSDWPVAPMDPLRGIYAAVTRRTLDGRNPGGWHPAQKVPLKEAVHASTLGGAYAECMEADKGSVSPGKLADFVVLDRNLFEIEPEEIEAAGVDMTICGGKVVYERGVAAD
jgi:predicted amidohydrolase YtcJ